jgi:hypothetical protein
MGSRKSTSGSSEADPDPRCSARGPEGAGNRSALARSRRSAAHRLVELCARFRARSTTRVVSIQEDSETGEVAETHRQPNLQPFRDDPDCWLVASIEDYDLETDTAKPGPIFSERVIAPPAPPSITSPADALAVVLNERGHVDIDHIAELLHSDPTRWSTSWARPSSVIRPMDRGRRQTPISRGRPHKLAAAEAAAELDPP